VGCAENERVGATWTTSTIEQRFIVASLRNVLPFYRDEETGRPDAGRSLSTISRRGDQLPWFRIFLDNKQDGGAELGY